jgi:hypothetical protein
MSCPPGGLLSSPTRGTRAATAALGTNTNPCALLGCGQRPVPSTTARANVPALGKSEEHRQAFSFKQPKPTARHAPAVSPRKGRVSAGRPPSGLGLGMQTDGSGQHMRDNGFTKGEETHRFLLAIAAIACVERQRSCVTTSKLDQGIKKQTYLYLKAKRRTAGQL